MVRERAAHEMLVTLACVSSATNINTQHRLRCPGRVTRAPMASGAGTVYYMSLWDKSSHSEAHSMAELQYGSKCVYPSFCQTFGGVCGTRQRR
jgi:hypothetical protein